MIEKSRHKQNNISLKEEWLEFYLINIKDRPQSQVDCGSGLLLL